MKRVHRKTSDILGMHRQNKGAIARSRSIDHQLDEDRERRQKEIQLLILGGAGSGKSTFIKQLRIHHGDGYPDIERSKLKSHVYDNVADAIHVVLVSMPKFNIEFQDPHIQEIAAKFQRDCPWTVHLYRTGSPDEDETVAGKKALLLSPTNSEKVQKFNKDFITLVRTPEFKQCYAKREEFEIPPSQGEEYFLDHLDRVMSSNYIPTLQDILFIRKPTLGVQEHAFTVDGLDYRVIDVAGQKNQRKKWIHFFEGVTAVIFFASLSGFDETLEEDHNLNNLQDSLQIFSEVSQNEFLDKTDIVMFLNKHDVLLSKLKKKSIKGCFPDYEGDNTPEACIKYIKDEFLRKSPQGKHIYTHVTTATNIELMKTIIQDVLHIIVEINLRKASQPY
ncbi:G protein alpha i subunit-like isoform X2 [Lineus longissimus]|uniref:G protein alpha i subunit-like isoform X2 n=1 Tax=Lineus longissimus TaxID=88925 RepID=UPI00315CE3CF